MKSLKLSNSWNKMKDQIYKDQKIELYKIVIMSVRMMIEAEYYRFK